MEILEFKDKFEFLQNKADTYGMEKRFGKIQIAVKLNDNNLALIKNLVQENMTEDPVKRNEMLYLKEREGFFSKKQKDEILDKGPMCVKVKF